MYRTLLTGTLRVPSLAGSSGKYGASISSSLSSGQLVNVTFSGDMGTLGNNPVRFRSTTGQLRVGVQFELDANGILHVLARDLKTGQEKIVKIESAVNVDDAEVQRMVEDSVEHAFEDMAARRWVEARLKANDLICATRKARLTEQTPTPFILSIDDG